MARRVPTDFSKMPKETYEANVAAAKRRKTTTGIYDEMKRSRTPLATTESEMREIIRQRRRKGVRIVVSREGSPLWRGHTKADALAKCGNGRCTIHLHPFLKYRTPRYVKDVIDHELDHVKVYKRGGSKYWS